VRQALNRYTGYFRAARNNPPAPPTQTTLKADMERLSVTLNKLENQVARVAVFGLVSRGKSAVLNALLGQKVLPTGPINGVTLSPQVVVWTPYGKAGGRRQEAGGTSSDSLQIELIDTPGLDEIDGQTRAEMAQTIARQSDLILFIVSGDITRTEFQALCELRQAQKPLLVVFNKIDLYPDQNRQAIYQSLRRLASTTPDGKLFQRSLTTNEIVLVAAGPAPMQVRVEQPDGNVTYEWETPVPLIDPLKEKILEVLQQEGRTLMALNALVQVQAAEARLAGNLLEVHQAEAEALIWKFVSYKAIAIAVNPFAVLDLVGGTVSDLAMIRALSNLYGLPITGHEAGKLWKTILLSSGSLMLTEIGSGLVLGLGKSAAAAASGVDAASGITAYAGTAIAQASFAGLGSYAIGRAAQAYLENGCSWGPQGASTTIQDILKTLDTNTILYRIRQDLSDRLS
jgi:small GTP-binding protein